MKKQTIQPTSMLHYFVAAICTSCILAAQQPPLPHIFFVIVDDLGWGDVGYHHNGQSENVQTPHIDSLVREGVELNRHYVHMTCTPTRSSFQTGRLPVNILTDFAEPSDEKGAIPRNMTGIASVLKRAGYATHQVGKWDAGMVTPHHTPKGRGYDTSLSYFSHGIWMYSSGEWGGSTKQRSEFPPIEYIDLWDTDRPSDKAGEDYIEVTFRERIEHILDSHDKSKPLFLQYDSRLAHYPLQAPLKYQEMFSHIWNDYRRVYSAMVRYLDDQLLFITQKMESLSMWDNTLMVLTSDNGGFVRALDGGCIHSDRPSDSEKGSDQGHGTVCFNGEGGANNYPLRGGKYSYFEGGVRVSAFVSGGYLPKQVRGTKLEGSIHIADWYRTLAEGIAGTDPTDDWAHRSGLPPIDSLNMWPMISGANLSSPRDDTYTPFDKQMIIGGRWKFVAGGTNMSYNARGGVDYPNASTKRDPIEWWMRHCPAQGCLFDVVNDPTEEHEVSADFPDVVDRLSKELKHRQESFWQVDHKMTNRRKDCLDATSKLYGKVLGPWKELGEWAAIEGADFHTGEQATFLRVHRHNGHKKLRGA